MNAPKADKSSMNRMSGWVFFDETPSFTVDTQRISLHQGERISPHLREGKNISCAIIGRVLNLSEMAHADMSNNDSDACIIAKVFEDGGLDAVAQLEGMFTIFIFDGRKSKGYLLQDDVGSNLPLYYTRTSRGIRFSTQLRKVLEVIGAPREPDIEACFDFLLSDTYFSSNIIPNHRTLVSNVHKLMPETCP